MITALIARTLGPELYGKYTFGLTYILLFSILSNFGIETLFVREAARNKNNIMTMFMDIMHLKCILALFTIIVIAVSVNILNYQASTVNVIYILSIGMFFQIMYMTLMSVYKSVEKMSVVAFFSVFFRITTALMVVGSVYIGLGLMGIVWTFTIGNALVFLSSCLFFYKDYRIFHFQFNLKIWKSLITKGLPFYLSALLTMVYMKINVIMLSKMQGELELGYFMAAATLVETLYFMPEAVNGSLFPAFSRLYGHSMTALKKTYLKMIKYVILITTAVCGGCLLIGDKILLLIYGDAFIKSAPTLNILIFAWAFTFFAQMMSNLLFTINKEYIQVRVMCLACVINILLNFLMINEYGIVGSAYALVLTEGTVVVFVASFLWKSDLKYVPDWTIILRLVGALIVMSVFVRILGNFSIVVEIFGGALSYIAFLFIMRVFDNEDILYIKY